MSYAAILFDLDGTTADSIGLYEEALLGSLRNLGIEMTTQEFLRDYHSGKHLADILTEHGLTEEIVPTIRMRRDELYEKLLGEKVEWFPGAEEALQAAKGIAPIAIVTGSWRSYVDRIRLRLDLDHYTKVIVTAEDMGMGRYMKPHPYGLLVAAERLGIAPAGCVYIGDQGFDIEAAHAAGMHAWLVRSEHTPPGIMEKPEKDFGSLKEVTEELRKIEK